MSTAKDTYQKIVELTEQTTALMEAFGAFEIEDQEAVLEAAFKSTIASLKEEDEIPIPLIRCAEMLVGVMTENVVKTLILGLEHANPTVRLLSGDAITHVAEENLSLLGPAIDDILKSGSAAAEEMPFILSELENPEAQQMLVKFLDHENAEVVASALEAFSEIGEPDVVPAIEKLTGDTRTVAVDAELGGDETTTVGQLAKDAIAMITEED